MVWNRHTPAATFFYTYAAGGDMAQTQKLEIKFHPSKSDEELLDSVTVEEIDVALLTAAQALLLLNADPTWRSSPISDRPRRWPSSAARRKRGANDASGSISPIWGDVCSLLLDGGEPDRLFQLTIHEALPLTNPAGNTGATLVQTGIHAVESADVGA
jgi:hypothetical protein